MSTAAAPVAPLPPPAGRAPARTWTVFATVLTWAVFLQAVTAGRILTGDEWARDVHRIAAGLLVVVAVVGGLVALVRLRDRAGGGRFGLSLVVMGVALGSGCAPWPPGCVPVRPCRWSTRDAAASGSPGRTPWRPLRSPG